MLLRSPMQSTTPQPELESSAPAAPGEERAAQLASDASAVGDGAEAAAELSEDELQRGACALLFASPEPLSLARLAELLGAVAPARLEQALGELQARFERAGLPLVLRSIAGGYRILTDPGSAELVARLTRARKAEKISGAALETLAIIAYRQPVTKAEIEAIRGVQAGPVLRSLVDRGLARIAGRADQPGSPLQYATTKLFLDQFGLESLKALPRDTELTR
jgi:segregation and condensation protein B